MSFWVVVPSWTLRKTASGEVTLFAVEVGVQSLSGEKTRRTVLRRFSDFVALAARLRTELGADKQIPPPPPKQRLARVDSVFLTERRRSLEAWLWALLGDVEIAHSQSLITFLELAAARKGAPAASPAVCARPCSSQRTAAPDAARCVRNTAHAPTGLRKLAENEEAGSEAELGVAARAAASAAAAVDAPSVVASETARDADTRRAAVQHVGLSTDQRASVRRALSGTHACHLREQRVLGPSCGADTGRHQCHVLTALQQRYAASKADLSEALSCLRSEAAVKALLARRVDELEHRMEQLSAAAGASAAPHDAARAACVAGGGDGEDAERCVAAQWELEEARSALRASEAACASQAAAFNSAERNAAAAQAVAASAGEQAEALRAELLRDRAVAEEASARAAAERRLLAKEVKNLRRDLAAATALSASTAAESAAAGRASVGDRLTGCLREANTLRDRLAEATVEHLAAEQGAGAPADRSSDPLELLAVSDARVALLTAEAQLLCRCTDARGEADAGGAAADAEGRVREVLSALLSDNTQLRRQCNGLLRALLGNSAGGAAVAPAGRRLWWQPGSSQ
jgi:hypothetical protein